MVSTLELVSISISRQSDDCQELVADSSGHCGLQWIGQHNYSAIRTQLNHEVEE